MNTQSLKEWSHERVSTPEGQISNEMTAFHDERHQEQVKECEKPQPGHQMHSHWQPPPELFPVPVRFSASHTSVTANSNAEMEHSRQPIFLTISH